MNKSNSIGHNPMKSGKHEGWKIMKIIPHLLIHRVICGNAIVTHEMK